MRPNNHLIQLMDLAGFKDASEQPSKPANRFS